jgi:AcrR family transcriptional regulator
MAALAGADAKDFAAPGGGLRERKKAQTRLDISDTATRMFLERGFDEVTVAEIAAAADVSVKTIFNYFGAKEDLLFDREPEWLASIDAMAARRAPGHGLIPVVAEDVALRWPALEMGEWTRLSDEAAQGRARFYRLITQHQGLNARRLQMAAYVGERFKAAVAEDFGRGLDDPDTIVAAGLLSAAYQSVGDELVRRIMRGDSGAEAAAAAAAVGKRGLDVLAVAYAGTPLVDGPPAT